MAEENKDSIQNILAHSYLSYFIFSFIGLFVDTLIGFNIYVKYSNTIAIWCFFVGSLLILWAQYTSGKAVQQNGTKQSPYFLRGPYRYVRNPTHLGIVILVAGYTLVSGSLVFFFVTLIGYLTSNVFFKEYESVLYTTYGDEYKEYKSKTPKIL